MGKYNTRGASKRIPRNAVVMKENVLGIAGSDDEISTSKETNKKRKGKTPVESEKEPKRIKKANSDHDSYCWKCHNIVTKIENLPEIECSTCPRSFHSYCIKSTKIDKDRSCYVCQQQSDVKTTSTIDDELHLSKLLLHIIDTACPMDSEEYRKIVDWPNFEENEKLFCRRDFRLIRDRCVQKGIQQYESHVELIEDIEWIQHNCIIIYGDKSQIATSAKKILHEVQKMLKDALDCPECYYKKIGNEPLAFLNICKIPHPLVWAKVKGYSYWPAKCLKVSNQKAHVRFFHTHQIACVPLSNVLAMSEDYPSNSSKKQDKKSRNNIDFVMAMGELEAYVGIFKDHYGKFPYQEKNTPFDFKREENILKELLKNHSREAIVSDDTFPSSSDNESGSSLAVVDLTDDLSEDDGDQITENVATSMQKSHTTTTLFEQDVSLDSYMVPNGFLENGNRSANETNNSNNSQEIIDTINNDSMIKTGFQHSMDVLQGNPKELQDLQEVITGSLLPSETTDDVQNWLTHRMPSPAGISISNVISGTDVSSGTDLAEVAHCDAEPVMQSTNFSMSTPSTEPEPFQSTSVFSTSSNSMHLCLRNYDRVSEAGDFCDYPPSTQFHDDEEPDIEIISELSPSGAKTKRNDTDCILQAILRCDPKSLTMLKQANRMVQQFFIQFWGATAKVPNPEKIIKHQENEIHNLKIQLEEKRREISLLKNVTYEEKMQNADNIVQCLKLRISKQDKENEKLKEELEKLNEEKKKLKEKEEKLKEESEIQKREIQNLKKELDKLEARFNERLKEAKTMKYCSLIDCSQAAKILCCYSGLRSFAYCSEKCKAKDDVHKRFECKAGKRTGPLQVAEEKEATPEQVVARGVVQQSTTTTIYLHKEITSSSATPQTANIHKMNKVVAAKKTYEMSRNINRNTNSPDIY